jgi:drug/metabolite transporter (DMT)-like permease
MNPRAVLELVFLAAIWGASFLFMRVLAPLVGAVATADFRMLIGGLFLGAVFLILRFDPGLRKNFRIFLLVGLVNSALPFLLYSWAALTVPASVEVVFNALSPAFGAAAAALFLGEPFGIRKIGGLILGFVGVVFVSGGFSGSGFQFWASLGACILAPVSYAVGGVMVKRWAGGIPPRSLAFGSQFLAGLALLPLLLLYPPRHPDAGTTGLLILFGVLCSGLAYLFYYRLMQKIGPTKTLTVTYLMPVFGILWGALFLGEPITFPLIVGTVVILAGTALVSFR